MHNSNFRSESIMFSSVEMGLANQVSARMPWRRLTGLTYQSALLQAIAGDHIPSIPQNTRVLLLGQTQSSVEDDVANLSLNDTKVVDYVVRSDRERERFLAEEQVLSSAVDNAQNPTAAVFAYRRISHQRLERRTREARQIATRRSGARGIKARKTLNDLEEAVERSAAR